MPQFEVVIVRTIRTRATAEGRSAAEVRRRVNDPEDSFADDLFQAGTDDEESYRVVSVTATRKPGSI